jgi:hypothetical protein
LEVTIIGFKVTICASISIIFWLISCNNPLKKAHIVYICVANTD